MKLFWNELFKIRKQVTSFLILSIILLIDFLFRRLHIIFWITYPYMGLITILLVIFIFILGAWLWIRMALFLPKIVLLIPLALVPLGLVFGTVGFPNQYFALVGMVLVLLTGIPLSDLLKKIWLISAVGYFVLGFSFFDFLETGLIFLHLISFGFAYLQFGPQKPSFKTTMAIGGITLPSLLLLLVVFFSIGSFTPNRNRQSVTFTSPFGTTMIFIQELENHYIDTNRTLSIYNPLSLGFFQRVGFYTSEAYVLETISEDDFIWELVEGDTYNLYISTLIEPILIDFSQTN